MAEEIFTQRKRPLSLAPWLVLGISLLANGIATYYVSVASRARDEIRFESGMRQVLNEIQERVNIYTGLLQGGAALFAASERVTAEEFHTFATHLRLAEDHPGMQGYGFAQRVTDAERAAFLAAMRAEGKPDFEITPPGAREEYFPIIYLAPPDRRNRGAVGYDMFSEPVRRAAMERAAEQGRPAATGKVTLVQEIDDAKQAGFLVYVPVYRGGATPPDPGRRRTELAGFVYSPFRADDLFNGIFSANHIRAPLHFEVYDGKAGTPANLLHRSALPAASPPRFTAVRPLTIADRPWQVAFASTPEFQASSAQHWVPWLFLAGALLSVGLAAIVAALARTQARGQMILESIADAFISFDRHWRYTYVNERAAQILQRPAASLLGKTLWDAFPSLAQTLPGQELRRALADQKPVQVEHRSAELDRWLEVRAYPSPEGVSVFFQDVTDRKTMEDIRERQARQDALRADVGVALARPGLTERQVLEACTDAIMRHLPAAFARIWTLNADTGVLELQASSGHYTHLDGPHSRIRLGQFRIGWIAQERRPHLTNDVPHDPHISDPAWARAEGMVAFAGYPLVVDDRVLGVLALFARQPLPPDTLETLATISDIVAQGIERKRAEHALALAQEELKQRAANLEQTVAKRTAQLRETISDLEAFSYSISHDLRAPLRAMQGYALVLEQDCAEQLTPEARDYVHRIYVAGTRLDRLIQDVLAYGRVARTEQTLARVELDPLVADILQQHPALQPPNAHVTVATSLLPVLGDESLLTQCVSNLLLNAVKFVAPGVTPRVEVWTEARDAQVRLWVGDNGIGIPLDQHDRIFQIFERLHTRDHYEGTGIGLAIVRKAVERMGGRVGVESKPGAGSRFWLELKRAT